MIRLKELKKKNYPSSYEELYQLIYGLDIERLVDFSDVNEKGEFSLDIRINNIELKEEINISNSYKDFTIMIQSTSPKSFNTYQYERIEFYNFTSLTNLVYKLKQLLIKHFGYSIISPVGSIYEGIYNLISYADIGLIADDSTWRKNDGIKELRLLLVSEKINKIIWIEHYNYSGEKWVIKYNELDKSVEDVPFDQYIVKQEFDSEQELYNHLKEMISPCLKKRQLRDINYKYKTSFKTLLPNTN